MHTIEDVVKDHVNFSFGQSGGWFRTYCEVCGDGKRTKGPRGGWRFEDEACWYHCFNCGIKTSFDSTREIPLSRKMKDVFEFFRIPKDEYYKLILDKQVASGKNKPKTPIEIKLRNIDLPSHFYLLRDALDTDNKANKAKQFLSDRLIPWNEYPFYLSTGIETSINPRLVSYAKSLSGRLIIPEFRNGNMIYYQARTLFDSTMKYISVPDVPRGNVIYGFDKLYKDMESPLFITEGFFDAYHLDGVAIMQNSVTSRQMEILNRTNRTKVLVPDRHNDHHELLKSAIDNSWGVSTPNWGDCKDVCEAVRKYGKLYTIISILQNIKFGNSAKLLLKNL